MPAAYAHLKFGEDVLSLLSDPLSERLRAEDALFRLGLIGPDFLFFYCPALPNIVTALGRKIHADAGLRFFFIRRLRSSAERLSAGRVRLFMRRPLPFCTGQRLSRIYLFGNRTVQCRTHRA